LPAAASSAGRSDRLHADRVCIALQAAYWRRKPAPGLIMHSDRGSQYASDRYRKLIADFSMLQSMTLPTLMSH